jgi:hypothetical protein
LSCRKGAGRQIGNVGGSCCTADEVQAQACAAFDRQIEDYRRGDHLELPISVKLAAGRKPTAG